MQFLIGDYGEACFGLVILKALDPRLFRVALLSSGLTV